MHLLRRLKATVTVLAAVFWHHFRGDEKAMANAIWDGFSELGGVYIKFLQTMSLRSRFIESVGQQKRNNVFEEVKPDNIDINQILFDELGSKGLARFSHVEREPFAAGSFGQVYRARLTTGENVVIKALRPSILKYLNTDLRVIRLFIGFIVNFMPVSTANPGQMYREFKGVLKDEIDYKREANLTNTIRAQLMEKGEHIVAPKVWEDLTSDKVMVQERMDGVSLKEIISYHQKGGDAVGFVCNELGGDLHGMLKEMHYALLLGIFTDPYIPGDPHPGNIIILPGGRLALIDFGIVAETTDQKNAFFELMKGYRDIHHGNVDIERIFINGIRFYSRDLYQAFEVVNAIISARGDSDTTIDKEVGKVAARLFTNMNVVISPEALEKKGVMVILDETLNDGNRFGLNANFDGITMVRSIAMYNSILQTFSIMAESYAYASDRVIAEVEANSLNVDTNPKSMSLDRATEVLTDWMQNILERDPMTFHGLVKKIHTAVERTKDPSTAPAPVVVEEAS